MSIQEIENKVRELRQLQALIEEATAEAEAIKDTIKAQMGDNEELRAGEYKVTCCHILRFELVFHQEAAVVMISATSVSSSVSSRICRDSSFSCRFWESSRSSRAYSSTLCRDTATSPKPAKKPSGRL